MTDDGKKRTQMTEDGCQMTGKKRSQITGDR